MCPVSALLSPDVGIDRLNLTKNGRCRLNEGLSSVRSAGQTEASGPLVHDHRHPTRNVVIPSELQNCNSNTRIPGSAHRSAG